MIKLFSVLGAILMAWFLRESGVMPIIWNIAPYIILGILALGINSQLEYRILLMLVLIMLFFDLWMYVEIWLGTKSSFLLAVSLISTLKIFVVFPIAVFCKIKMKGDTFH